MDHELNEMSYEELEKREEEILNLLNDASLPLDKAKALYEEGQRLLKRMDERLRELEKTVTDEIQG